MRRGAVTLWLLLAASCLIACGRRIVVDGVDVYEPNWIAAQEEVGRLAAFQLECPRGQLRFRLFERQMRSPSVVGVEGCGRRIVYRRVGRTWFDSSQPEQAAAAQRAAEAQARRRRAHQRSYRGY